VVDNSALLVWDSAKQLSSRHGDVSYWQSYSVIDDNREISVPQLVEDDQHLRLEYLALIYEYGETKTNGRRLVDYLEIRPGFSYWWMTLLVEKCNISKSPQINNVIKMMAFKKWFETKNYTKIKLVTLNYELADSIRQLALELGVDFEQHEEATQLTFVKQTEKKINGRFKYSVQAMIWFTRHIITHWSLKGVGVNEWKKSKSTTTFVSYLFNHNSDSAKESQYESKYWTKLPELLTENHIATNWLHIYVKDEILTTASKARDIIKQFNRSRTANQTHVTLHSFLSVKLIASVLREWYQLNKKTNHLDKILQYECGYLWPLFKRDFLLSFSGITAINNILFFTLFEKAMTLLPVQKRGYYLQENQGWEFGFIHSWYSAKHHGKLVGVPHATVRYWDLRYFFDSRSYEQVSKNNLPLPDFVAINGELAKNMYLDAGYKEDKLIEVEALRYLYLFGAKQYGRITKSNETTERVVLVFGDYDKENTSRQMHLLQDADYFINDRIKYIVKPHPACPILEEDYPSLHMIVANEPVSELLKKYSVVYTNNVTSSVVDAYCMGRCVVVFLDPSILNFSPLRGISEGVTFVSGAEGLAQALKEAITDETINFQEKDYFYIDANLRRWKKILSIDAL